MRRLLGPWLAVAGSVALLWAALPAGLDEPLPWLAWVAFVPWLRALDGSRPVAAAGLGLGMGLAYVPGHWATFAAANAGLSAGLPPWVATAAFFLNLAFPFAIFGFVDARWLRGERCAGRLRALVRSALLASLVSGIWAVFPYTPAVAIAGQTAVIQVVELGGEVLVLWLLLFVNASLAQALAESSARRAGAGPGGGAALACLLPAALAVTVAWGYGTVRIATLDRAAAGADAAAISVLPLQLDLPSNTTLVSLVADRAGRATSAIELTRRGLEAAPRCELVVWPELPVPLDRGPQLCRRAAALASELGVDLLANCSRGTDSGLQSTAELLAGDGGAPTWHGKSALIPVHEWRPWVDGAPQPGDPGTVLPLASGLRVAPAICYELHSRTHLRQASAAGAGLIVHMASFASFGRQPIDRMDAAMARLRAVEFRMPIVRSTNRGSSGWIDQLGRFRDMHSPGGRRADCLSVRSARLGPTLFSRIEPVAPWLPVLLALLAWRWTNRRSRGIGEGARKQVSP